MHGHLKVGKEVRSHQIKQNELRPVTGREGTEGQMKCSAFIHPVTFGTTRTVELSALCAGSTLTPRKFLGTHFC